MSWKDSTRKPDAALRVRIASIGAIVAVAIALFAIAWL
jgi:hypothetical protein